MNPFDTAGPEFLAFWLVGAAVVALAVAVIRRVQMHVRGHHDVRQVARTLHPTELAYLAGGVRRAVETAVVALEHQQVIQLDAGVLRPVGVPDKQLDPVGTYRGIVRDASLSAAEQHVLAKVPATIAALEDAPALDDELATRLKAADLIVTSRESKWLALWALPALWMGLGAAKVLVGIARDRPVILLVGLLVGAAVVCKKLVVVPRLTRLGEQVLARMRRDKRGLETTARVSPSLATATEMSTAYALFGPSVLMATLAAHMPTYHAGFASFGSSGTSSGTSCGGGGASCGGGGGCGGGCGGCS